MTESKQPEEPTHTTPGRPTESGSRQQHHPGQEAQTGSKASDREATSGSKDDATTSPGHPEE